MFNRLGGRLRPNLSAYWLIKTLLHDTAPGYGVRFFYALVSWSKLDRVTLDNIAVEKRHALNTSVAHYLALAV